MSPGLVLNKEDCQDLPDPRKQKYDRSFVAKLQFTVSWICFDISLTISSLSRFCESAGPFEAPQSDRWPKQSNTQFPRQPKRCCTFVPSWSTWVLNDKSQPHWQFTRTILRALNGETTSSVAGSEPSTFASGNTFPMKLSRVATWS